MTRESTREKLLDAGLRVFYQQGFNGSGVQDITDAAGVPKGSFYNHFVSKEALGVAVVERYWQSNASRADVLHDASLPPLQRLRRHFELQTQIIEQNHFASGCLLGNFSAELADQSSPVRTGLSSTLGAWSAAIENCIREAQQHGDIQGDRDARELANFVLNAWEGSMLRAKVEKRAEPLEQFMDLVFARLLT